MWGLATHFEVYLKYLFLILIEYLNKIKRFFWNSLFWGVNGSLSTKCAFKHNRFVK
jgi:hypothetical protein